MNFAMNPTKAAFLLGRQGAGSSRCRSSLTGSGYLFNHSKAAVTNGSSLLGSPRISLLRDLDIGPRTWGNCVALSGAYTTSISTYSTTAEDYDAYTLYGSPIENTQCNLGAIIDGPSDADAAPFFDEEGRFCRYATLDSSWTGVNLGADEEWSWNKDYESYGHDVDNVDFWPPMAPRRSEEER